MIKSLKILSRQVIKEDTILTVDADKGKVKWSFGSGLFYLPHGLKIDSEGNTWVTDVGLHQVIKFNRGETQPSLGQFSPALSLLKSNKYLFPVLGEKFVPGNDAGHFCKPTSVAVASSGRIFVADG